MELVEQEHWWYRGLREMISLLFDDAYRNSTSVIVDAGCGTGANLRLIRSLAPNSTLVGVDSSHNAISRVKRDFKAQLCGGDVNTFPFADSSIDLITAFDLLGQRGVKWAEAIDSFYRALKPGGKVMINVPSFNWLRGAHDNAVHVVKRFAPKELSIKLSNAGFTNIDLRFWNTLLLIPMMIWRCLTRSFCTTKSQSDLTATMGSLNVLLSGWIRFEARLSVTRHLPFGSSIFVTAQKPDTGANPGRSSHE